MLRQKWNRIWKDTKETFRLGLSLAVANFKLRNEGSYLGILWYLLNPLLLFLIILFVKGSAFSKLPIKDYPIYLLLGLILNNFFVKFIKNSMDVIHKNGQLLKSVTFHLESLVISELLVMVFSHFFEYLLLVGFMIGYRVDGTGMIWYLPLFFLFCVFLTGASFLVAVVGVFVFDLSNVWDAVSSLIFFITPIFYAVQQGTSLYTANLFNPLYYFVTIFRDMTIYHTMPPARMLAFLVFMSFVSFAVGLAAFRWQKHKFAELV